MEKASDTNSTNNSGLSTSHERSELAPLYSKELDNGTLRLIIIFFSFFSMILTFALAVQIHYGYNQVLRHGSVTSDHEACSTAGISIIQKGGNSVDAAIATAFCLSVVNPHITGLGAGGLMIIYSQRERKVLDLIDFRVTRSKDTGIGIPGFVAGLSLAHELHGTLPWKTLLEPAIYIARSGFQVPRTLLESRDHLLSNSSEFHNLKLKDWLSPFSSHSMMFMTELGTVLSYIAIYGSAGFYNNTLREDLSKLVDENDVIRYEAMRETPLHGTYNNFDIVVPSNGSGGPLLLNALSKLNSTIPHLYSLIDEFYSLKDWPFVSGSNVVAFDVDDIYVSLTSGLGSVLGSQILTNNGYILNNILETTPDINKRPMVLMSPLIAVQNGHICGRRLALGSADIRDLAQVLLKILEDNPDNLANNVEDFRARLIGSQIALEWNHTPQVPDIIEHLRHLGYELQQAPQPYPSINVIQKIEDDVTAYADSRGFGYAAEI